MFKFKKFDGLVAAPFTPMDSRGNLNVDLVPDYYSFLEKNGVTAAFINGSTGEGPSMTQKEKEKNATAWAAGFKAGGRMRIINLVGGTSYQECIENAHFSLESGFHAIALVAPYYFKPPDDSALAEYVAKVGESVPDMPLYFYHIPVLTGVNMPMIGFLRKITSLIPNFAGIKFTHEDFMDFLSCLKYENGKYDLLWGRDECLLSALVLGCRGAVGSTFNYAAPLYNAIIKGFNEGKLEEARKLQEKSIEMIALLGKYGGIAVGKSFMKYVGLDCGEFRSPVRNMTERMYGDFVRDVDHLSMERYFSSK
jgi:N-acetylneuraminate lyase